MNGNEIISTAKTVANSLEDLIELLEYAVTVKGSAEADRATLEAVKRLQGIRYGVDLLQDKILAD